MSTTPDNVHLRRYNLHEQQSSNLTMTQIAKMSSLELLVRSIREEDRYTPIAISLGNEFRKRRILAGEGRKALNDHNCVADESDSAHRFDLRDWESFEQIPVEELNSFRLLLVRYHPYATEEHIMNAKLEFELR